MFIIIMNCIYYNVSFIYFIMLLKKYGHVIWVVCFVINSVLSPALETFVIFWLTWLCSIRPQHWQQRDWDHCLITPFQISPICVFFNLSSSFEFPLFSTLQSLRHINVFSCEHIWSNHVRLIFSHREGGGHWHIIGRRERKKKNKNKK